jgi:hypothetical protein
MTKLKSKGAKISKATLNKIFLGLCRFVPSEYPALLTFLEPTIVTSRKFLNPLLLKSLPGWQES